MQSVVIKKPIALEEKEEGEGGGTLVEGVKNDEVIVDLGVLVREEGKNKAELE